jgi:hypothetical protein
MASGDHTYHPQDAVKAGIQGALVTGAAGTLVSAVQNTLAKRNVSAWGVFTRTGGTIAIFGALDNRFALIAELS